MNGLTPLPPGLRCGSVPEAVRALAAGTPMAVLVVPGWLGSSDLRAPVTDQMRRTAANRWAPVHTRWAWLREDEDGHAETAFWVWPCRTVHLPGFQCQDGRVFHGNATTARHRASSGRPER